MEFHQFLLRVFACLVFLPSHALTQECPRGWRPFSEHCYLLRERPATWVEAKVICDSVGGKLAEIESAAENSFHTNLLINRNVSYAWIGMENFVVEGEFVWVSTRLPPVYTNWRAGRPDNALDTDDCGLASRFGEWDDAPCLTTTWPYICEAESELLSVVG